MKSSKGISLIALIVTIIVIIILTGIFINYSFKDTLDDTTFTRRISEMTEVYDAVIQRGIEHRLDSEMYPYAGTELSNADYVTINGVNYGDDFYYITPTNQNELKIERLQGSYVVNYETGEVISVNRIEYEGKDYYKLADIAGVVQGGSDATVTGEYSETKGVNKPILSEGMVPVKEKNGVWVATTEYDDEWYDYSSGKYATIMLMDELTLSTATNEQLRALTRSELSALASDSITDEVIVQGSTFIWIPRYTYKSNGEIVYSYLTQDYTSDGFVKSPAFYFGGYSGADTDLNANTGYLGGGKELTGIWISKYEAGFNK